MTERFFKLSDWKRLVVVGTILSVYSPLFASSSTPQFTEEAKRYWFFQAIEKPEIPKTKDTHWVRNPIDAFILDRLEKNRLKPTPEADRRTLIRRATLDLLGILPTPEEVHLFVNNESPKAYEQLIDRLLESPRYGERYARHWLDLVRYADTDGFKSDVLRPDAWRYRDYVIDSLNQDKSYKRFIEEQIAGDELCPDDDDANIATGYLRLWPYESNQPDMSRHWEATLDDIADVSGDVFLGLSMKCARCHDHKFDAISQKDYYRFRAFFASISPWEDIRLGDKTTKSAYDKQFSEWQNMTAGIRAEIDKIESVPWETHWQAALGRLPPYMQEILAKPERTPYEEQLTRFANKQITWLAKQEFQNDIKGDDRVRWEELKKELSKYDSDKPTELPSIAAVRDVGGVAPKSFFETKQGKIPLQPGYLSILDPENAKIEPIKGNPDTTGRRSTLASWLTDGENPLTVRVIVNRLWQWHFGNGIVSSSNDFGILGDRPTHPVLLDWLARTFVEENWSMKSMHRLIMTSATYRQGSVRPHYKRVERKDPENKLLWRMPVRRMDAEQLRDSMLLVSGELDMAMNGPAVSEEESARRSIYTVNKRNKLRTMMNKFDTSDLHNSCHRRDITTTPIQALALINGSWALSRAEKFAKQINNSGAKSREERITNAFRTAFGRAPETRELEEVQRFLEAADTDSESPEDVWADFCHVLMNTNEFIYIN